MGVSAQREVTLLAKRTIHAHGVAGNLGKEVDVVGRAAQTREEGSVHIQSNLHTAVVHRCVEGSKVANDLIVGALHREHAREDTLAALLCRALQIVADLV